MNFRRPSFLSLFLFFFACRCEAQLPLLIQVPEMYPNLQTAVLNAATGDFISLATGEHLVSNDVLIDKNDITILGRSGDPSEVRIRPATGANLSSLIEVDQRIRFTLTDLTLGRTRSLSSCLLVRNSTGAHIKNCVFTDHFSFSSGCVLVNSDVLIEDSTFRECLTVISGGAVSVRLPSDPTRRVAFSNCRFIENGAGFNGGSMIAFSPSLSATGVASAGPLEIAGCRFRENNVGGNLFNAGELGRAHGGALCLVSTATETVTVPARIRDCTFDVCSASEGGAIALDRALGKFRLNIEDCFFSENVARASTGAAIAIYDTPRLHLNSESECVLEVSGCRFADNVSEVMGGAISVRLSEIPTRYQIENCDFIDNVANTGGGIALGSEDRLLSFVPPDDDNDPVVLSGEIRNCYFFSNDAVDNPFGGGNGGAISLQRTVTDIAENLFERNIAAADGGAFFAFRDFSVIRENLIGDSVGDPIKRNTAGEFGGAVFAILAAPPGSLSPKGLPFEPESFSLVNNLISANTSEEGGGGVSLSRYFAYPGGAFIAGNYFLDNLADEGPGQAIYLNEGLERDVFILNNTVVHGASSTTKGPSSATESLFYMEQDIRSYLANNLLMKSGTQGGIGIYEREVSTPSVFNNDFFNLANPYVLQGSLFLDENSLNNPINHVGNLVADPLLREDPDPVFGLFDIHLRGSSPLIHAGTEILFLSSQQIDLFNRDIDGLYNVEGTLRTVGSAIDIGADEWNGNDIECDLVPGERCDALDLIALIEDRSGKREIDADFTRDGSEDALDLFGFATRYYEEP